MPKRLASSMEWRLPRASPVLGLAFEHREAARREASGLAVVLVGDGLVSAIYLKSKRETAYVRGRTSKTLDRLTRARVGLFWPHRPSRIDAGVRFGETLGRGATITPVAGDVGKLTIACLFNNIFRAAKQLADRPAAGFSRVAA